MLEHLFRDDSALDRHPAGPFAAERERYLQYCVERGATRAALRVKANELLWLCQHLPRAGSQGIDVPARFRRLPANGDLCVKESRPSNDWSTSVDHGSASWDGGGCRRPNCDFKVISNGM